MATSRYEKPHARGNIDGQRNSQGKKILAGLKGSRGSPAKIF